MTPWCELEHALGGGNDAFAAWIELDGHAQGAAKGLEDGLALMVGVFPFQVVDMDRCLSVIHEALEELAGQVHIETTDMRTCKRDVVEEARAPGEIDHDT